jgi:riboflavin kinase
VVHQLGIPTANIPLSGVSIAGKELDSGIYYGWAGLDVPSATNTPEGSSATSSRRTSISERISQASAHLTAKFTSNGDSTPHSSLRGQIYPMVMSVGWNPYYKNTVRSVEIHILHDFGRDFYGHHLNILISGFIRPEYDYVSVESLIEDIKTDIEVTRRSLDREPYLKLKEDTFLRTFPEKNEGKINTIGDTNLAGS